MSFLLSVWYLPKSSLSQVVSTCHGHTQTTFYLFQVRSCGTKLCLTHSKEYLVESICSSNWTLSSCHTSLRYTQRHTHVVKRPKMFSRLGICRTQTVTTYRICLKEVNKLSDVMTVKYSFVKRAKLNFTGLPAISRLSFIKTSTTRLSPRSTRRVCTVGSQCFSQ